MVKTKPLLCTGCRICSLICAWTNFQENNPKRGRIRIRDRWPKAPGMYVCRSCQKRDCLTACQAGALTWDGHVVLDKDLCTRCGDCVEACPVEGIWLDPATGYPLVCHTCGGEYPCVKWCPAGALSVG